MTQTTTRAPETQPIEINQLGKVRQEALSQGVPVIQILEETYGHSPEALMEQLGRLLRMPVLKMETLRTLGAQ